jgi:pyruvate kinase
LRTKVVATAGPATASLERIRQIAELGANVIRINFAHGTHEGHREVVSWVREVARERAAPIAILADLAGPKIRIGELPEPVELAAGEVVTLVPEEEWSPEPGTLPSTYPDLAGDVQADNRILLDDGTLELQVTDIDGARVVTRVVRGGLLRSNKGLNLPGVQVSAPSLTERDLEDLELATELGVDYVGLSFVQSPRDIDLVRERLPDGLLVVAKIEKDVALERLEDILDRTDAVMVARGDLGVELPFERVPLAQKRIIRMANLYGRPVITATQMLESMIEHPRPTRAEASDVANALLDGTDAVMLSGETAVGAHPFEAVRAMVAIAGEIEKTPAFREGPGLSIAGFGGPELEVPEIEDPDAAVRLDNRLRAGATRTEHAIAAATVEAVSLLGAPAIVTLTRSGFTSRLVSSYRPSVPILGVCNDERVYRQLALVWGVTPVMCKVPGEPHYDQILSCARSRLIAEGIADEGDKVVVTAGVPFFSVAGTTNMLRVEEL